MHSIFFLSFNAQALLVRSISGEHWTLKLGWKKEEVEEKDEEVKKKEEEEKEKEEDN